MKLPQTQTLVISNFGGRLTRQVNGDINSGLAKFKTSWGYDPFSQPGNLTWNYQPSVIGDVTGAVLAGTRTTHPYYYCIDNSGKFYAISDTAITSVVSGSTSYGTQPLKDQVFSVIGSYSSLMGTFTYGSSILPNTYDFFYVSSDSVILKIIINSDGKSVFDQTSVVGTTSSIVSGTPHPLIDFQGKIYYGNSNNIGEIIPGSGSTGVITTGTKLDPPLPLGYRVTDLDTTPEGDYLLITASRVTPPAFGDPTVAFKAGNIANYAAQSAIFYWNGSDSGATAIRTLPSFPAPALTTFLDKQYTVIQDTFGMGLMDGNQKALTLPDNFNPPPNALTPNGTFITWVSVEGIGEVNAVTSVYSSVAASLYYYGYQDEQVPKGLWRMSRIFPTGNQVITSTPLNAVINNYSNFSNFVQGFGKHYIATSATDSYTFENTTNKFYRFVLNPAGKDSPVGGVYETQTQLFSKRIGVTQIRVYCDPTTNGNAFQLDLIGSNGNPIEGGTYTYTYGDIVDPQDGSESIERINFPGNIKTQYSLGLRITNTGTTNMVIRKVEIDYSLEGK